MKLIIGLGNPDKEYEATRHNFGWLAVDSLADKKAITWTKHKQSNSLIASWQGKKEKIPSKPFNIKKAFQVCLETKWELAIPFLILL